MVLFEAVTERNQVLRRAEAAAVVGQTTDALELLLPLPDVLHGVIQDGPPHLRLHLDS